MQAMPISVDADGVLRLPAALPSAAGKQFAILVLDQGEAVPDDVSSDEIARLAQASGAFDFLHDEPDLYSDADIEPGHHNPDFAGHATGR